MNFANRHMDDGIIPLKEFLLITRVFKLIKLPRFAGMLPVRQFLRISMLLKDVIKPNEVGIVPFSLLALALNSVRKFDILPKVDGSCPVNLFVPSCKLFKSDRAPSCEGIVPVKQFDATINCTNTARLPMEEGILPAIFLPLMTILCIWPVVLRHVTPVHLHVGVTNGIEPLHVHPLSDPFALNPFAKSHIATVSASTDGTNVGANEGLKVGNSVGDRVGISVGAIVGILVGKPDGCPVGSLDGSPEGTALGVVGSFVG
jgi:hypothetical protein